MPINQEGLIVRTAPNHVQEYLSYYYTSKEDLAVIDATLKVELTRIKSLAKEIQPRAEFVTTLGAEPEATSMALSSFITAASMAKKPERYVHIDVGQLIRSLAQTDAANKTKARGVQPSALDSSIYPNENYAFSGMEATRRLVELNTQLHAGKWLYAALYLRDRLIYESLRRGMPVAIQSSGHGEHFPEFLADVRAYQTPAHVPYRISALMVASQYEGVKHKADDLAERGHLLPEHINGRFTLVVRDKQHATHIVTSMMGFDEAPGVDYLALSRSFDAAGKGNPNATVKAYRDAYRRGVAARVPAFAEIGTYLRA